MNGNRFTGDPGIETTVFKNHIYYLIYDLNKKLKRLLSCFGFTESTVSLIFSNTPSKHTVEKILLKKL